MNLINSVQERWGILEESPLKDWSVVFSIEILGAKYSRMEFSKKEKLKIEFVNLETFSVTFFRENGAQNIHKERLIRYFGGEGKSIRI